MPLFALTALSDATDRADLFVRRAASNARANGGSGRGSSPVQSAYGQTDGTLSTNYKAEEQYRYFRNWVWVAIRPIAARIMGQEVKVGELPSTPSEAGDDKLFKKSLRKKLSATRRLSPFRTKTFADGVEVLESHPLYQVLENPNPAMVQSHLFFFTVCNIQLTGHGYWWMNGKGKNMTLWPVPTSWVQPVHADGKLFSHYNITPRGAAQPILVDGTDICHFFMPAPGDPREAISPLMQTAVAVATDDKLERAQYGHFARGIKPDVILKAGYLRDRDGKKLDARVELTPDQRTQLIDAIRAVHRGVDKWGEPLIVDALIDDVIPFIRGSSEMDYLGGAQLLKSRIMQAFGVNPISAGEIEGANRASAVVADDHLCANVVNPLLQMMSQTMTKMLPPRFPAGPRKLYVYIEPAKANDPDLRLAELTAADAAGAVTVNEWRAFLNLPPKKGGDELPTPPPAGQPPATRSDGKGGLPVPAGDGGDGGGGKKNNEESGSGAGGKVKPKPKPGVKPGAKPSPASQRDEASGKDAKPGSPPPAGRANRRKKRYR